MNSAVPMSMWFRVLVRTLRRPAVLPKKRHKPQAEHIEGGEKRRKQSNRPVHPTGLISPPQNLVLAEEPGKRRDAGNGKGADRHSPKCPRNFCTQAAHLTHVLLATDRVDHRTRGQKQQPFEERMRQQMEN